MESIILGIEEGVKLTVTAIEPLHTKTETISVRVEGKNVVLGLRRADKILVLPYSNGTEMTNVSIKNINKYRINTNIDDWRFNVSRGTYFTADVKK